MTPTVPWGRHQQKWPPDGTPQSKAEPKANKLSEQEAFDLNKSEQVSLLKNLGVSSDDIKQLNNEQKRVDKILEVQ